MAVYGCLPGRFRAGVASGEGRVDKDTFRATAATSEPSTQETCVVMGQDRIRLIEEGQIVPSGCQGAVVGVQNIKRAAYSAALASI